jgi:hypothetical protein
MVLITRGTESFRITIFNESNESYIRAVHYCLAIVEPIEGNPVNLVYSLSNKSIPERRFRLR